MPDGVVTVDGTHTPADIICFATGFRHNDFLASMDVIGRGGMSLREQWGDEPTAYLGITIANFPNLFCVYGPGTNLAAGASLFYHSEFQVHYAMEAIRETLDLGGADVRGDGRGSRVATRSATRRRSARWCGRIPRSRTATTRTPRARSSRCLRGPSTSTGNGPALWRATTTRCVTTGNMN